MTKPATVKFNQYSQSLRRLQRDTELPDVTRVVERILSYSHDSVLSISFLPLNIIR